MQVLTVSHIPSSVLTVFPSWLSPRDSVTLNCEVEHPSAGWRLYWYKAVPNLSDNLLYYRYELLPGSSNGTEPKSFIVHGQTGTAGYVCRAGRGDPVYFTDYSQPEFVFSGDSHSPSLTVSPDSVQHFTSDSVSLNCEGNSTRWRVMRFTKNKYSSYLSHCATMTGSTCKLGVPWHTEAIYWCESGSGEFSNAVNITAQNRDIILLSPVRPVPEGHSVSLGCKLRRREFVYIVFFYRNDEVVQNDTRSELKISAASKSDEGFYKCQHSREVSPQSWMSVKDSRPVRSSFPVPLIVGLVCALVLLILLLLSYRLAKGRSSLRAPIRALTIIRSTRMRLSMKDTVLCSMVRLTSTHQSEALKTLEMTQMDPRMSHILRSAHPTTAMKARRTELKEFSEVPGGTMTHALLCVLWLFWLNVLYCGHAQDSLLTIEPNWSTFFTGESVMFICDMRDGKDTHWYYAITKDGQQFNPSNTKRNFTVQPLARGDSGEYQCFGRQSSDYFLKESNTVSLTVSDRDVILEHPASPLYEGETVTLRCRHRTQNKKKSAAFYKDGSLLEKSRIASRNTAEIRIGLLSGGSAYTCKFDEDESEAVKLKVESYRPVAELRRDRSHLPVGDNVTLSCSVSPPSSGWKYFWYRGKKTSEPLTAQDAVFLSDEEIRVSQGGAYWCRGGRGDPVYYTEFSDAVVTYRAAVTLQPTWPEIYYGETVTLICDIKDGEDAEWEYEWATPSSYTSQKHKEYLIRYTPPSHSGDYRCMGTMRGDRVSTEWSDVFTLTPSANKPEPVLAVSPLWLSPGDSVTLSCEVEHPSAGWRFYWYKVVPNLLGVLSYNYELLPGSSNGTEQGSFIVHGQTGTAGFKCRAGRGDPVYYTFYSDFKFVWCGDCHSGPALTVSPDRVQHFTKESVTLSCEGNSSSWRVNWFPKSGYVGSCSSWGIMNGSTCSTHRSRSIDGVYWCESKTGQFSNAVNITGQYSSMIMVSPVRPVAEGHPVTLSCKLKSENALSNVVFYKNGLVIQNDTRTELMIPAASKADEGFYKCKGKAALQNLFGWTSPESWMSVKPASSPQSAPLPVLLIVGGVCGALLIILLLLFLHRYTKSRKSCLIRSQSTNQDSAEHTINQDKEYTSVGDYACFYETVKGPKEAEIDEPNDVTYSLIHLKHIVKTGMNKPEESAVYSNMKIGSDADD
ncbi:Fc receptor-like protein 5 [Chaetodon trifascialis]|uniref:Fc receptor-like protein 5 n=1 Tax=Chaetodon trifascialis TaxID=109706 RepID=UPI003992C486